MQHFEDCTRSGRRVGQRCCVSSEVLCLCFLGQLGGFIGHDPCPPPACGQDIVDELVGGTARACLAAARDVGQSLVEVEGFEQPSWTALLEGVRPPPRDIEEYDPGCAKRGWQHEPSSRVERRHCVPKVVHWRVQH